MTTATPRLAGTACLLLGGVLLATACSARGQVTQDKPKPAKQDKAQKKQGPIEKFLATLKKEGIELDRKKKTMTIPVVVNAPTNDLEFLLSHPIGKTHETLLLCRIKPSIISSGLMALGLKKGENAGFKRKDPPPTKEEYEAGVDPFIIVPPKGTQIWMTVTFEKAKGKKVTLSVDDLLLDYAEYLPVTDNQWIYLGGRMDQLYRGEPPVFMADYEGNLISTCYKHPANHLVTMEHARARDDMNWSVSNACPPPGTEMTLTFHVDQPDVVKQRNARMAKEAAERKAKGEKIDLTKRPPRNPAHEGQGRPPRPTSQPDKKKGDKGGKQKGGDK